jgi:hypothetical protein
MGKSVQVTLANGRAWPRKGDAVAHFKAILNNYSVGDRILDPSNHADLEALLATYDAGLPAGEGKAGNGVAYFEKRLDTDHPGQTSCFFVVRRNGSSIDFSYLRAIDRATNVGL